MRSLSSSLSELKSPSVIKFQLRHLQRYSSREPPRASRSRAYRALHHCRREVVGCRGCDLAEAGAPVVAAAGEDPDLAIPDVDLDPVAVELDLVNPSWPG